MMFLHSVLFSMSSSLKPSFPYPPSIHQQIFVLTSLFFLFPSNSISINLLHTYSWSLLMTCSYHLSLPSLILNCSTLTVTLMDSFLILSFLVTPIANLNIFISATSIFCTCFFVTATVLSPYTIAGSPLNCTLFLLL